MKIKPRKLVPSLYLSNIPSLIERDLKREDRMTHVITLIRDVMHDQKKTQMPISEILKQINKGPTIQKLKKEDIEDVLEYYKKLQVIFMDQDDNVVFL